MLWWWRRLRLLWRTMGLTMIRGEYLVVKPILVWRRLLLLWRGLRVMWLLHLRRRRPRLLLLMMNRRMSWGWWMRLYRLLVRWPLLWRRKWRSKDIRRTIWSKIHDRKSGWKTFE